MPEALRLVPVDDASLLASIRQSFPILNRRINGCPLVYCDSAASSLTPIEVIDAEAHYYKTIGANVHRGSHALAVEASEAYEAARAQIARFLGARPEEIVFTANATAALNLVASGLGLDGDDEVLATLDQHHASLLPFQRQGRLRVLEAAPDRPLEVEQVARAIGPRTKALLLLHGSNVTGVLHPLRELCQLARERGLLSIVDAAQSAPHVPLDMAQLDCDFLAFSGHKLLGPTGIGVLYGRSEALARLVPRDIGGGTVARVSRTSFQWNPAPACFEAGTPNIAGALGLAAATRFLERLGWAFLERHHRTLADAAWRGLAQLPELAFVGRPGHARLPTFSVTLPTLPLSVDVLAATLSDRYGVMVRSGLHCAHPLFEQLGLHDGALRASFYLYNTLDDVHALCASLSEVLDAFR